MTTTGARSAGYLSDTHKALIWSNLVFCLSQALAAVMQADCVLKPCIDSILEVEVKLLAPGSRLYRVKIRIHVVIFTPVKKKIRDHPKVAS